LAERLSIVDALVFDGEMGTFEEQNVHVVDGRIVQLGGPVPAGSRTVHAAGGVVTPGLIDAHFHAYGIALDLLELESTPPSFAALVAAQRLRSALRRGFTTVRDVAGGDLGLRQAIDKGLVTGPRYLFTGRALSQTGGHGDPRPADRDVDACRSLIGEVVDGVDAVRGAVRERFRVGAHAIKMMTSGGVVSPTDPLRVPQYSAEEIAAAVDEATRRGSYVAAHAYSPEAIVHSVGNGVRSIEHGNLMDATAAEAIATFGAYLVPTLVTYDAMDRRGSQVGLSEVGRAKNQEVLEAGLASIELARASGVAVGFGTDLMGDLEDDQLLEFRIRCEVENPIDVLRSATTVNAELIQRPDLGRIAEGNPADLVVFERNPLEERSVLWDQSARIVVAAGRVVE
jgi:imidazolonepropionase-like amidohydrolase